MKEIEEIIKREKELEDVKLMKPLVWAYIGDNVAFFYRFHNPLPLNWNSNEYNTSHYHEDEFIFHKVQRSVNPKVIYIPAERNFVSVVPNLQ